MGTGSSGSPSRPGPPNPAGQPPGSSAAQGNPISIAKRNTFAAPILPTPPALPTPPRSSLDPVLRMEERGLNPQLFAYAALGLAYLCVTPGVLPGAIDYYIRQPLQRLGAKVYGKVRRVDD